MEDGPRMLMWHYLIQFPLKKLSLKTILSINVDVLKILVGKIIRDNEKSELRVLMKLFIESEISYLNKST